MDDATLLHRRRLSQIVGYRGIGTASPGAAVHDVRPGVLAAVVPVTPGASLPNSVLYTDAAAVLEAYDELVALYADAGVRAWTVWVVPEDDDLAAELQARGHVLDGSPTMMAAPMEDLDLGAEDELDLHPEPRWADIGALSEAAFGIPAGRLAPGLADMDHPAMHPYVALLDGEPAACLATIDGPGGDCSLQFVATAPAARGRGLATALVRRGLRDARERGFTTASLEASAMGEPVYARLGYRAFGPVRMFERRSA